MKAKSFRFKEFTVEQYKCAMKIGTDGVLLGAWVSVENYPETALDIGAGTGVIALQLAQRTSHVSIEAVEIDEEAFVQASENFEGSPWADRLYCFHATFQELVEEIEEEEETYDLIVSNPPFYTDDYQSEDKARNSARFETSLPFSELVSGVARILSNEGVFATIIPFKEEEKFLDLALKVGLYPKRICRVKGTDTSPVKRSLLEFSKQDIQLEESELTLELSRHQYTQEYIDLVKDFYLKM